MKKKLLPALLALVMVLGMLPMAAFALGEDAVAECEYLVVSDGTSTTSTGTFVEAVEAGAASIKLLKDVEVAGAVALTGVALDTNDNTLTVGAASTLTLTNVNLNNTAAADSYVYSGGSTHYDSPITVAEGGVLTVSGGTYTSNVPQIVKVSGTANISGASFVCNTTSSDGAAWAGDGVITVMAGTLNMPSGSITVNEQNSDKGGETPSAIACLTDGTIVLGAEGTEGPTLAGGYTCVNMNNTLVPVSVRILSGNYSTKYAESSDAKWNGVLYLSAQGDVTIEGGTFTPATVEGAQTSAISLPYTSAGTELIIEDGQFNGKPMYVGSTGGTGSGANSATVNGGTFAESITDVKVNGQSILSDELTYQVANGGKYTYCDNIEDARAAAGSAGEIKVLPSENGAWEEVKYIVTITNESGVSVTGGINKNYQDAVTLNIESAENFEVDTITVVDTDGNPVSVTGTTFVMPNSDVTVTVTFKRSVNNGLKLEKDTDKDDTALYPFTVGGMKDGYFYVVRVATKEPWEVAENSFILGLEGESGSSYDLRCKNGQWVTFLEYASENAFNSGANPISYRFLQCTEGGLSGSQDGYDS